MTSLKNNMKKVIHCRKEDEEGMEKVINEKLSQLFLHQLLKHLELNDSSMDFDATSF